ncbi:hypothetical protein, partial [uncultured Rikenella sp.]|uniref:hypothetical protein n=1 Tax=uncultured Rikenella sp. TaxID=368003 RepID=UPI00272BC734
RLKREIVKTRLRVLTRFPQAREKIARKNSVARSLKEGFRSFCVSKNEMKSQRATAKCGGAIAEPQ